MTDENMQVLMLPRQNRSVPERLESGSPEMHFGKVYKKEFIGDDLRPIDPEDIIKAGRLMYVTALLMMFVFGGIKLCTVLIM